MRKQKSHVANDWDKTEALLDAFGLGDEYRKLKRNIEYVPPVEYDRRTNAIQDLINLAKKEQDT